MYRPIARCAHCARVGVAAPAAKKTSNNGKALLHRMAKAAARARRTAAAKAPGKASPKARQKRRPQAKASQTEVLQAPKPIEKTAEAYKVPIVLPTGQPLPDECVTWPRYDGVGYVLGHHVAGESMLDLSLPEVKALRVVELRVKKQKEKWPGGPGHYNWKKTGLSTAKFMEKRVCRESMPTAKALAAFDFLTRPDELNDRGEVVRAHGNAFYKEALAEQQQRLDNKKSLWISSFDLFINCKGIECAIEPVLYPTSAFTDTGLRHVHSGSSNRIFSIGDSWTRKATSSVRVYAECVDLIFFLYERSLANKFYNAHVIAKERNLTADVLMRSSQVSTGFWDVVQDTGANYCYYYYHYYCYCYYYCYYDFEYYFFFHYD